MVELQPSKLVMRVRFPSSALMASWLVKALIRVFEAGFAGRLIAFRAINGPLANRHQGARRAVIVVIFSLLALALGFDMGVDVAGDDLVRAARLVLVDKRGPFAVVAHPRHEILDPRAASGGEGVAGMAKIVE